MARNYQYSKLMLENKKFVFVKIDGKEYSTRNIIDRMFDDLSKHFTNELVVLTLTDNLGNAYWFIGPEEFAPFQMQILGKSFDWKTISI